MVYKYFDKKISSGAVKSKILPIQQLAEELHKPIIRKFEKQKVHLSFIDNFWGADLEDMQLISKFNKGFQFLLCVIDIYSKYAWVIPLKDKNGITITNDFKKVLTESNRKPNKIWIDKGSEFYNRSMKSWLQDNVIGIYSINDEGKFNVAKKFIISTWKKKNLEIYEFNIEKCVH